MKYVGSKRRLVKHILPIMLRSRRPNQWWVEPFVGGGNMICRVSGRRLGADINRYTIEALTSIRDCLSELPKNNKEFTEEDYKKLRHSDEYKHKGYASFAFSFGSKLFGGWSRCKQGADYVERAYKNAQEQSPLLQGVELVCENFYNLEIPDNSLIYCDPPYENTLKYKDDTGCLDSMNYKLFWQWCREQADDGHIVFISSYEAPEDFKSIWEKSIENLLQRNRVQHERLFVHESQIN